LAGAVAYKHLDEAILDAVKRGGRHGGGVRK
jgi:hypothetical protein